MTSKQSSFPQTSLFDKRFARLLDLLNGVNESIDLCKDRGDSFGVKQYTHLKKQYVTQLVELLEEIKVSVAIKEAA